jgi:hypothetical protein
MRGRRTTVQPAHRAAAPPTTAAPPRARAQRTRRRPLRFRRSSPTVEDSEYHDIHAVTSGPEDDGDSEGDATGAPIAQHSQPQPDIQHDHTHDHDRACNTATSTTRTDPLATGGSGDQTAPKSSADVHFFFRKTKQCSICVICE